MPVLWAPVGDIAAVPVEGVPHGPAERPAAAAALRGRGITEETAFILVLQMEPVAVVVMARRVKTATQMGLERVVTEAMAGTIAQNSASLMG